MKKIHLQALIDKKGLDLKDLADELFPRVKYPVHALKRVISGEGELDASQIVKLSAITGESISDLFEGERKWTSESPRRGLVVLTSDEYRAEFDTLSGKTTIFHKDSIFSEEILTVAAITLPEYLEFLNNQIQIFKKAK